jgi:hypothetical protein
MDKLNLQETLPFQENSYLHKISFTEGCIRVDSACHKALTALHSNTREDGQLLQNSAKANEEMYTRQI